MKEELELIEEYFITGEVIYLKKYFDIAFKNNQDDLKSFCERMKRMKTLIKKNPNHILYDQYSESMPIIKDLIKDFKNIDSFKTIIEKYLKEANHNSVKKKKTEINKMYTNFLNEFKTKNDKADYIIFYESPPSKLDNYILNNPSNSHYCNIIKNYFSYPEGENIQQFLIDKKCLFVDILDIPINLSKDDYPLIRMFWSEINPPFTYLLFRKKVEFLIKWDLINHNTKVAIGMPPNSSLGIYNFIPLDQDFYNENNIFSFFENLIQGNGSSNRSASKIIKYKRAKFNAHKSNIFFSQNPNLEFLRNAWE
jgi:hypothetical protein